MKEKRRAGEPEGGRRPSGGSPREEEWKGSLAKKGRWSRGRKRDLVLRLLRGESLEGLSRETGVEIYRLKQWRDQALSGMEAGLREREGNPLQGELDAALRRPGEVTMENELLWRRVREKTGPLAWRWTVQAIFTSPINTTIAFAGSIPPGRSPPSRGRKNGGSAETAARQLRRLSSCPLAWRWTARATSTLPMPPTTASAC